MEDKKASTVAKALMDKLENKPSAQFGAVGLIFLGEGPLTIREINNMNKFMRLMTAIGFALVACGGNETPSTTNDKDTGSDDGGETTLCGNCDDGVACTDDVCADGECQHLPLHGRCDVGTICDPNEGCSDQSPCVSASDCPDIDGPCVREACDAVSATCVYTPLDADGDGHSPQICATVGGDDCDDANPDVNPEATDICGNGLDDDCDGSVDNGEACELCREACEKEMDCNPRIIACRAGEIPPDECPNEERLLARCVDYCAESLTDDNVFAMGPDKETLLCEQEHEWGCGEVPYEALFTICSCHKICTYLFHCQLLDRYGVESTDQELAIDQCTHLCPNWEPDFDQSHAYILLSECNTFITGGNMCDDLSSKTCFEVAETE